MVFLKAIGLDRELMLIRRLKSMYYADIILRLRAKNALEVCYTKEKIKLKG